MSFSRIKPTYVSLSVSNKDNNNTLLTDSTINATIRQVYSNPMLDNASDYVMCVERLELSTNGIPFYPGSTLLESIYIGEVGGEQEIIEYVLEKDVYSLTELLIGLSELLKTKKTADDVPAVFHDVTISINEYGHITMTLDALYEYGDFNITFPQYLNNILGLFPQDSDYWDGNVCTSKYPRLDIGDYFSHIILTSTLPTVTDNVVGSKELILTDFAPPSSYGVSYSEDPNTLVINGASFNTNIRQKLIYVPNERRYLELNGNFPIQNIEISAKYIDTVSEDSHFVPLPIGGTFQIKLGFYKK